MKKRALIKCVGFIGDNIFASGLAEYLSDEPFNNTTVETYDVDIKLSIAAPYELIANNPYVCNVFFPYEECDESVYDKIFELNPIHRSEIPTKQFRDQCNITHTYGTIRDREYVVYTNEKLDDAVKHYFNHHRPEDKKIAIQLNWEERSFLFTEEEYKRGINVPPLGYGGKRRNVNFIVSSLDKLKGIAIVPVGKPNGFDQRSFGIETVSELSLTASIIKNCDYFIGSEGGLCNIAAGVGTKTIITGDFVHQLYGWNGVIEKNEKPMLGPEYYFPTAGHISLNPYLTDEEVIEQIAAIIC